MLKDKVLFLFSTLCVLNSCVSSRSTSVDKAKVPSDLAASGEAWMEDDKENLKKWLELENTKTSSYFSASDLADFYASSIDKRLSEVSSVSGVSVTFDGVYTNLRLPGEVQSSIVFFDGKSSQRKGVLSELKLDKDQSISYFIPSPNNRYGFFGVMDKGSEVSVMKVVDLKSNRILDTKIDLTQSQRVYFSEEDKILFYRKFDNLRSNDQTKRVKGMTIRAHKIGSDPKSDSVVVGETVKSDPPFTNNDFFFYSELPKAGVAIATAYKGTIAPHNLYFKRIDEARSRRGVWKRFLAEEDNVTEYVFHGDSIYFLSSSKSNLNQIERIHFSNSESHKREVVFKNESLSLDSIAISSGGVYAIGHRGLGSLLVHLPFDGQQVKILPQEQGVDLFDLAGSERSSKVYMQKSRVSEPDKLVSYRPEEGFRVLPINSDEAVQVELEVSQYEGISSDSTKIPYELVRKKGSVLDENTPVLLRSYATFGNKYRPFYDRQAIDWYQKGGVIVYCYARGGGELGEEWHKAAIKSDKYRSIEDTIACAEDIIARGFSSPQKLAFFSGSAGGVIAGNLLVRRPDLFAAIIIHNGVLELSKLQTSTTFGSANISEFGDINVPAEADAIYKLDPYRRLETSQHFPAVLCIHGFNDLRVPVWMSAKFVSKLREFQKSSRPILMRTEFNQGHGIGSDRSQRSRRWGEIWAFLTKELKIE